jgi:uncharacterized damage-inducible protein DinB
MPVMASSPTGYPPNASDERTLLEAWLVYQRETLARKCEGLDDQRLREASAPPSPMTLLGLVRHMAEVERNWFQRVLGEHPVDLLYGIPGTPQDGFGVGESDTSEEAFATWRTEIARADRAAARHGLDHLCRRPRDGQEFSLRWIYLHMIEEYARHNGHADLIRESLDGLTGE